MHRRNRLARSPEAAHLLARLSVKDSDETTFRTNGNALPTWRKGDAYYSLTILTVVPVLVAIFSGPVSPGRESPCLRGNSHEQRPGQYP